MSSTAPICEKPPLATERAVVAERPHVAHRRRDHHRRAVEVRVLELARALARARGEVHVDEGGLARGLRVAVRGRQHQRLGEEQDRLHAGDRQQRVEEAGLRAPGIGERVRHALRDQLVDQELPARPEHALLFHAPLLASRSLNAFTSRGLTPRAHPNPTAGADRRAPRARRAHAGPAIRARMPGGPMPTRSDTVPSAAAPSPPDRSEPDAPSATPHPRPVAQ